MYISTRSVDVYLSDDQCACVYIHLHMLASMCMDFEFYSDMCFILECVLNPILCLECSVIQSHTHLYASGPLLYLVEE